MNSLVRTQEYKRHWTALNVKEVVVADPATARRFAKHIQPMLVEQETLWKVIRNLRRVRDLLLPRLLLGGGGTGFHERQRCAFKPAWGNAPGTGTQTGQGLKARL